MNKENTFLVLGPPGTGKTTYIKRQVERALQSDYAPEDILLTSYTRAAAATLVERELGIPKDRIGTLHAHCYRILGSPALAESKLKLWNDNNPGLKLAETGASSVDLDDSIDEMIAESNGEPDKIFASINILRARLVPQSKWPLSYISFFKKWNEWKKSNELMDFTDLLETVYRDYDHCPIACKVIFVDEAQDLTPLQFGLVAKWGQSVDKLILCGDDDQTLYDWAGASPDELLGLNLPETNIKWLTESFRIPKRVHEIASRWVKLCQKRYKKDYDPREFEGEVIRPHWTTRLHNGITDSIAEKIDNDETVMVLASCSYMLTDLLKTFKAAGLKFFNPYRVKNGAWNIYRNPSKGETWARKWYNYFTYDSLKKIDWTFDEFWSFAQYLKSEVFSNKYTKKQLKEICSDRMGTTIKPMGKDSLWEIMGTPEHFEGLINQDTDWLMKHLLKTEIQRAEKYLKVYLRRKNVDDLATDPKLVIGTIHSVKGAEADNVYLFPDLSLSAVEKWRQGIKDSIVRQFYVGITRAKNRLYICQGNTGNRVEF